MDGNQIAGTLQNLKWGEWVMRQRRSDGYVDAIRVYMAIDEISPGNDYDTRQSVARILAAGNQVTAGNYRYLLAATETDSRD